MDRFRNWRWYKKFSAGPIADLGSHQIDIFSWFLHAEPTSVQAIGSSDYYEGRDWYADVMTLFEYPALLIGMFISMTIGGYWINRIVSFDF